MAFPLPPRLDGRPATTYAAPAAVLPAAARHWVNRGAGLVA
jgi:hypothetical protein